MSGLHALDGVVVAAYFLLLLGLAWWVVRQKQETSADYFLAGRHIGWFVIGASIFASNIGSEHIVGLAGTAAKDGLVMGHYELHAWLALLLGWVFVPFYLRSRVFTTPEFLERRFAPSARWFLSLITLIAYVLTKVSVTIYAGGIVFQVMLGSSFWTGAFIVVLLTGVYTIMGGLRAVVYTETLQAIILLVGAVSVTAIGLVKIGGWNELVIAAGSDHFNLFLPADHPDFPWTGMVFAPPIVGLWYWCTDQYIVQRTLAAKNEAQARRGTIWAAYLKLLPFFLFMIPGVIAYALAKTGQLEFAESDHAFPALARSLLPIGLRGLVTGAFLAALMSSLAACFNSCSTLFTMDIYRKLRPDSSEKTNVLVGRIATGVVVLLGILWIPFMKHISSEVYHYLQGVQAYFAPPIASVFLLGIFWKRINTAGALTALIGGFVLGMGKLVAELNEVSLNGILLWFAEINFLHFAIFLFLVCVSAMTIVSLLTTAPSYEKIRGLTYATTVAEDRENSRASWNYRDLILSAIIVLITLATLVYFSPLGIG